MATMMLWVRVVHRFNSVIPVVMHLDHLPITMLVCVIVATYSTCVTLPCNSAQDENDVEHVAEMARWEVILVVLLLQ
jgi:fructose/tagatose bisphosphate aldolase